MDCQPLRLRLPLPRSSIDLDRVGQSPVRLGLPTERARGADPAGTHLRALLVAASILHAPADLLAAQVGRSGNLAQPACPALAACSPRRRRGAAGMAHGPTTGQRRTVPALRLQPRRSACRRSMPGVRAHTGLTRRRRPLRTSPRSAPRASSYQAARCARRTAPPSPAPTTSGESACWRPGRSRGPGPPRPRRSRTGDRSPPT